MLSEKPLNYHFKELRQRLIFSVTFFVIAFSTCLLFSQELYQALLKPILLNDIKLQRLIFTNPTEIFFTYIKISFLTSVFISLPIFLIQTYLFLSPGLYKNEKLNILLIFTFSPFLFMLGALFAYFYIIPVALKFFLNFEVSGELLAGNIPIQLEARISEYLSFNTKLIFGFGLAFELPIILLILIKFKILSAQSLASKRKYWILLIFVFSAMLTPPDVISQVSLAIPMIILFEISLLIAKMGPGNGKKKVR